MSQRLESGMPTGPGPPSSMDPRYSMYTTTEETEGYDVQFVPALEQKYECPICLMALRDPMQTECGHRFCRACIYRSIRDAGPKCPVDQSPLSKEKVFPDNFAKREILSLTVHCPNSGCTTTLELRDLENHREECEFFTQRCPNGCGVAVSKHSMALHLQAECVKRSTLCQHCHRPFIFDQAQLHRAECPESPVVCEYCGIQLPRREKQRHIDNQCLHAFVPCTYSSVGCDHKMKRKDLVDHQQACMEEHLKLVTKTVGDLKIQIAGSGNDRIDAGPPHSWHHSTMQQQMGSSKKQLLRRPMKSYWMPSDPGYEGHEMSGAYGIDSPRSDSMGSGEYHFYHTGHTGPSSYPQENRDLSLLREKLRHYEEHRVIQEQKILELQTKVQTQGQEILSLNTKIQRLETMISNGVFYWKIDRYSDIQRKASTGETNVMHSPPFYTGYYGYKMCLRINLNGTPSAHGLYVSLFVHFMQGEWDDMLQWPFSGKITLSILDQSDNMEAKQHLSETLIAKPSLAAFHRPVSNRNHKGFGYMEFAPLTQLESRVDQYIRNNSIVIKATVDPN
ncbi:TNF receptor-associated factor 6-like [Ptychodera flava]|uniref:TNF receptor-associated factor 6-like n=1 Tax=Ptychodera flava TaxID=63121 RepID=UPI00396A3C0A